MSVGVILLCDVVIHHGRVVKSQRWKSGPFPIQYEDHRGRAVTTDAAARATNFPASLGPFLLGTGEAASQDGGEGQQIRWHAQRPDTLAPLEIRSSGASAGTAEFTIDHLESLAHFDSSVSDRPGILAVHGTMHGESLGQVVEAVDSLATARAQTERDHTRGAVLFAFLRGAGLMDGVTLAGEANLVSGSEARVYPLVLVHSDVQDPALDRVREEAGVKREELALFCAASGQRPDSLRSTPTRIQKALEHSMPLSRSWRALVMRKGAAIMLASTADPKFVPLAEIYARTLYSDALMLARLQDFLVREYENDMHRLVGNSLKPSDLSVEIDRWRPLSRRIAVDRARYWMNPASSTTGHAIMFLREYQAAVCLHDRLGAADQQVHALTTFAEQDSREAQTRAQERVALLLGIFGVIAIPLGIMDQVLSHTSIVLHSHGGAIVALLYALLIGASVAVVLVVAGVRWGRR
ncbi:hypothetical protein [Brachybacterium tyrofermentans]|uniref:hypothetical protein n=1 Tax=Brachybacterium tyrofermentans TaxID=47848 RepID=UPI003F909A78